MRSTMIKASLMLGMLATALCGVCWGSVALAHGPVKAERNADVSPEQVEARWNALKDARARHMRNLRAYRNSGVFPDNSDLARPLAVFIDRNGVPCAFANLMMKDGQGRLVRHIARTQNNLLVGDVTGGAVMDWIKRSGFTHAEAAAIQVPGFMYREPPRLEPGPNKVQLIQARLDQVIRKLDQDASASLTVAVAQSFPRARLTTADVRSLLHEARRTPAPVRTADQSERDWVQDVIRNRLGGTPRRDTTAPKPPVATSKPAPSPTASRTPVDASKRDWVHNVIASRLGSTSP